MQWVSEQMLGLLENLKMSAHNHKMPSYPSTTAGAVARIGPGLFYALASNVRFSQLIIQRAAIFLFIFLSFFILRSGPARAASPYCFEEAGAEFDVSPQLLWSMAKVESRFNPAALKWDRNGSYDFGVMQINAEWAPRLGEDVWQSLGDPCTNIRVGAWILSKCIHRYGYSWEAVGCYNASSKDKRVRYARKVYVVFKRYFQKEN